MTTDTPIVWVDESRCSGCFSCASICPNQVFAWRADVVEIRYAGRCIECGHCVAVCPTGAFHHAKLGAERFEEFVPEYPLSQDELQALLMRRRSCRKFTDEPVTQVQIDALREAAAAAPTATNSRNVRFVVLDAKADIDALARRTAMYYLRLERQMNNPVLRFFISLAVGKKTVDAYKYHLPVIAERFRECLNGSQCVFSGAPLVLVAFASGLPHIASANCNLAVMQMMHMAEAVGLATCYNGYALTALVRDKRVRNSTHLPSGATPAAVLAVGHPAVNFHRSPKRRRPRMISIS